MQVEAVYAAGAAGPHVVTGILVPALAAEGIEYRPCHRASGSVPAHLQLANSSRRVLADLIRDPRALVTVNDVRPRTRALMPTYWAGVYPLLHRAHRIGVHSHLAARMLRPYLTPSARRRIRYLPLPAPSPSPLGRDEARALLGWEDDALVLVVGGAIRRVKLVTEAALAARVQGWRLCCVGRRGDEDLMATLADAGATVVADPDPPTLAAAIAGADAALVMRRDTVGETNYPLLEALAAGRPIIANRVGTIPETGADAPLYTEASAEGIARALRQLTDPARRAEHAARSRARAAAFAREPVAARWAETFREAWA